MAKSQKPKSKKRQRGRRPGRSAGAGGRPRRTDQPTPEGFELDRLIADVEERAREAHAPDTTPERVAEILAEDSPGCPPRSASSRHWSSADPTSERAPSGASCHPAYEGLFRLAVEHAWLHEESEDEELADSWFEAEAEPTSALQLFAADPDTPRRLATAARNWGETVTYGLWQLADPAPAPGVWLTDLVSGVRRYVAVPPAQIDQASRWTVLIGALVAVDGTWRTTGTVIPLRPGEGDGAAELAREMTIAFFEDASGERIASRRRRKSKEPEPHGVLVGQLQPAPQPVADLMSKIVANLIPEIAADVMRRRSAGIGLTNMDGHRVREITAELTVADAARQRLAGPPDFRAQDEPGELSWWGRELTKMEREGMLAQVREQLGAEAALEAQQSDERPQWLRGRLRSVGAGFEVEATPRRGQLRTSTGCGGNWGSTRSCRQLGLRTARLPGADAGHPPARLTIDLQPEGR